MKINEQSAILVQLKNLCGEKQSIETSADSLFYELRSWPKKQEETCLHKSCKECQVGSRNHVHMISCPCRSCSPWY